MRGRGLGIAPPRLRAVPSLGALALAAGFLLASGPPAHAACPNEAIREAQVSAAFPDGTTGLPDCMALEMVSPSEKFNQAAFAPSFAPEGGRVLYTSAAGLAETEGLQSYGGDSYVAERGPQGWVTAAVSPPRGAVILNGGGKFGNPYAFSPDLRSWLLFGATQSESMVGIVQFFHGAVDGSLTPLSPRLVAIDNSGTPDIRFVAANTEPKGTSADLGTTVFSPPLLSTTFLAGDFASTKESNPGGDKNQYVAFTDEAAQPALELLARDRFGVVHGERCGTHVGGGVSGGAATGTGTGGLGQGAVSADGSRIYFTTRPTQAAGEECDPATNPLRIMKRTQTPAGPEISELIPAGPAAGSDLYQGASADGTKVYLTTTRQLSASDKDTGVACGAEPGATAGCDLYLYDSEKPPAERLTQVSAGGAGDPTPGKGANVLSSVTAISGDGSHVYFAAEGVLTTDPNPEGDSAGAGEPNLYLYEADSGQTSFLGTLSAADMGKLWGVERSFFGNASAVPLRGEGPGGSQVGGDGHILLFASGAALTADDTDAGKRDIFRYDADAATLERISKAAPGGSEAPAADAIVNRNNVGEALANPAEEGRWVSEDGKTVGFASAEPLVPGDEDEAVDLYLWKDGQLALLPREAEEFSPSELPTLSTSGAEFAFTSSLPLLATDGDTAFDTYILRAGGGFAIAAEQSSCNPLAGGCQAAAASPPAGSPATLTFVGQGNVKAPKRCKKGFVRKHGKCTAKKCKRGFVKKRGKCTKKKHKRQHNKHSRKRRGGSK